MLSWFLETGIYVLAVIIIICLAIYAATSSFKKEKMKLPPKSWKDVIYNKNIKRK